MFEKYNILNLYGIFGLLFVYYNRPISAITCYQCSSTFPGSNICLPACSQSFEQNSTCILKRTVPLEESYSGSLFAGHISADPSLSDVTEKQFVFGEEAAYLSPSVGVGWDWEYGPLTYGCDTPGCNNPQIVNDLPNALNARIPNEKLNQLLNGDINGSCYQCDICLDASLSSTDMSSCTIEPCINHACGFVATRRPATGNGTCLGRWSYRSYCLQSAEPPQLDMTLMYYIRSKSIVLYQMEAVCRSDKCNNLTTFHELRNAITVDPDLSCLPNGTGTTPSTTISTTTQLGTTISTTQGTGRTTTQGTGGTTTQGTGGTTTQQSGGTTTQGTGGTTTQQSGGTTTQETGDTTTTKSGSAHLSAQYFISNNFILLVFLLFYFI